MGRIEKTYERILSGRADYNIEFADLVAMLTARGFTLRAGRGSHIVATKPGIADRLTLQPDGSKATGYQVRQVRNLLLKCAEPEPPENP